MKKSTSIIAQWRAIGLLLLVAALIAACSGNEEPTPTPVPPAPTATTAAAEPTASSDEAEAEEPTEEPAEEEEVAEEAQAESPLAQPESPLMQPESPLARALPPLPTTEEEAIALAANTEAPEPTQEGLGSLSGILWSSQLDQAIYGIQVYLVEAEEYNGGFIYPALLEGPVEGSIVDLPNEAAQVLMDDVPPGNYYMVVWTVYDWIFVNSSESGEEGPRLITVKEGERLPLGVLYVDWP